MVNDSRVWKELACHVGFSFDFAFYIHSLTSQISFIKSLQKSHLLSERSRTKLRDTMATQAHCAYCFETLVASFERRQPLGLAQVEELWQQYQNGQPKELPDSGFDEAEATDVDGEVISSARPAANSKHLNREPAQSAASSGSSLSSTKTSSSTQSSNTASGAATPSSSMSSRSFMQEYPLFVTWNTISRSGHKSLRGCIGTFEAQEIEYGLHSYALTR